MAVCALSPALPAVISRGASRREARGWVVASRECAPRHADRGPSGAASSTPRPRSSTASTGSAVNRTAADRCAPCADTHRVLHAPRHGDAGHSRHCECDLTRALRGARGRDPRLSLRARFCSPYLFLAPFSIKNKNIKNSKSSLRFVLLIMISTFRKIHFASKIYFSCRNRTRKVASPALGDFSRNPRRYFF